MPDDGILKKAASLAGTTALISLITLVLLCAVEGGSSFFFVWQEMRKPVALIKERGHTEYDRDLGWINKANISLPDFYGPGINLKTNSQRFRNDRDITPALAKGQKRVLCVGDSFTLGFGVKNSDTWCNQLSLLEPGLESVNMGQGGYGIDQSYLWYMRDGVRLEHNYVIFSFISNDFNRMVKKDFWGYGKPALKLSKNGMLKTENIPIPRRMYTFPLFEKRLLALKQLRIYPFLERAGFQLFRPENQIVVNSEEIQPILLQMFRNLSEETRKQRALLVVVYFPALWDYDAKSSDFSRQMIQQIAARLNLNYFDFVDELRKLPRAEWDSLYGWHNHFNEKGNLVIARMIRARMIDLENNVETQLKSRP